VVPPRFPRCGSASRLAAPANGGEAPQPTFRLRPDLGLRAPGWCLSRRGAGLTPTARSLRTACDGTCPHQRSYACSCTRAAAIVAASLDPTSTAACFQGFKDVPSHRHRVRTRGRVAGVPVRPDHGRIPRTTAVDQGRGHLASEGFAGARRRPLLLIEDSEMRRSRPAPRARALRGGGRATRTVGRPHQHMRPVVRSACEVVTARACLLAGIDS